MKTGLAGVRVARSDELRGSSISGAQRFGARLGQRAGSSLRQAAHHLAPLSSTLRRTSNVARDGGMAGSWRGRLLRRSVDDMTPGLRNNAHTV